MLIMKITPETRFDAITAPSREQGVDVVSHLGVDAAGPFAGIAATGIPVTGIAATDVFAQSAPRPTHPAFVHHLASRHRLLAATG